MTCRWYYSVKKEIDIVQFGYFVAPEEKSGKCSWIDGRPRILHRGCVTEASGSSNQPDHLQYDRHNQIKSFTKETKARERKKEREREREGDRKKKRGKKLPDLLKVGTCSEKEEFGHVAMVCCRADDFTATDRKPHVFCGISIETLVDYRLISLKR